MYSIICQTLKLTSRPALYFPNDARSFSRTAVVLTYLKRSLEDRRRRRNNSYHFYKYLKSRHNLTTCDNCGHLYRKWHLCSTCYDQTRYETQVVRSALKAKNMDLSEESMLKYKDDVDNHFKFKPTDNQQVINIENRSRPSGWFNESLWKESWCFLLLKVNSCWKSLSYVKNYFCFKKLEKLVNGTQSCCANLQTNICTSTKQVLQAVMLKSLYLLMFWTKKLGKTTMVVKLNLSYWRLRFSCWCMINSESRH